jgi:amino acid adenylation domain-containing protein
MSTAATTTRLPADTVHHAIGRRCAERREATALVSAEGCVTYAELWFRSGRLARKLSEMGIAPGARIGVLMPSSLEMIISLLAIMRTGAAFVPLDPAFPADRLRYIVADSELSVILTAGEHSYAEFGTCPLIRLPMSPGDDGAASPELDSLPTEACLLYTSGSAGRPKGVLREHRALLARLAWFTTEPDDVFCHNMSLSTGFSQERLFLPLMLGARLAVLPDRAHKDPALFVSIATDLGVTKVSLAPPFLREVLALNINLGEHLKRIRTVTAGGAALTLEVVRRFYDRLGSASLIHVYGGTEAGHVTSGVINRNDEVVTVGQPLPGVGFYIVDTRMGLVPRGETGEVCVSGNGIAGGYVNLPEFTAQRFVPNPFDKAAGDVLYKTGDLARCGADGRIEIRGRIDRQVKVRGYRIELEELEKLLNEHPMVAEAAIIAASVGNDNRLIAYISSAGREQPTITTLREYLRTRVPDYMLPWSYVFLSALPRTPLGKLERGTLPVPTYRSRNLTEPYIPPSSPTEETVATIWGGLLGIDAIGIHDHFLDLGGDSVIAIRIVALISREFDIDADVAFVLQNPTVAKLASAIIDSRACKNAESLGSVGAA